MWMTHSSQSRGLGEHRRRARCRPAARRSACCRAPARPAGRARSGYQNERISRLRLVARAGAAVEAVERGRVQEQGLHHRLASLVGLEVAGASGRRGRHPHARVAAPVHAVGRRSWRASPRRTAGRAAAKARSARRRQPAMRAIARRRAARPRSDPARSANSRNAHGAPPAEADRQRRPEQRVLHDRQRRSRPAPAPGWCAPSAARAEQRGQLVSGTVVAGTVVGQRDRQPLRAHQLPQHVVVREMVRQRLRGRRSAPASRAAAPSWRRGSPAGRARGPAARRAGSCGDLRRRPSRAASAPWPAARHRAW